MTEVPEHLLKRSQDRRAALGLGGDGGGGAETPASASSAVESAPAAGATAAASRAAVTPAEATIVPAKPPAPYVQAALDRKKIPLWVMPVLAFLPVWAVLFVNTLSKPVSTKKTQVAAGADVYAAKCSSCHNADGSGGTGRPLYKGEVLATFPNIAEQLQFVWLGSAGTGTAGTLYGAPDRPGGVHKVGSWNGSPMPSWKGTLTQAELLEVVRHEREDLSGEKIPAKQLAADATLLWPNGKPMLSTTGELIDPDGKPLFGADGKLVDPSKFTAPDTAS